MKLKSPINIFKKGILWPISRAYSKYFLKNKPADPILRFLCSLQFFSVYHFWPNFSNPTRFSEKLWSRMLQDRNPLLALVSDKLKVRDYVASKIGSKHLIRLLWTGKNPDEIPYNILPSKFVIKTNHGAGYYIIVKDNKETLNKEDTTRQLKIWLRENYCHDKYLGIEWGYRNIKPTILIESFLSDNGKLPVDYKFFCFSGRVEFLFLHFDRLEEHKNMILDRNFESPPFEIDFPQWNGEFTRPKNFELMLKIAELLSQDFAFIRVDLYSVGEKVFFGELTPYPGGIGVKILRKREDYIFGNRWKFISNRNASF